MMVEVEFNDFFLPCEWKLFLFRHWDITDGLTGICVIGLPRTS